MVLSPEFLLQTVLAVGVGLGTYVAIRVDLAVLHEQLTRMRVELDKLKSRLGDL